MKKTFKDKVLEVVTKIPSGKVMSYKEVAIKAGSPKAYRAVGNLMNKNFNPKVPCHRVVGSDGHLVGYRKGLRAKAKILKKEGVKIEGFRVVK